MLTLYIYTVFI